MKKYNDLYVIGIDHGYGNVKQRALGYKPRAVPPDALFVCLEMLGELADKASSPELDKEIYTVLKQITAEFLLPGKG